MNSTFEYNGHIMNIKITDTKYILSSKVNSMGEQSTLTMTYDRGTGSDYEMLDIINKFSRYVEASK